jgi:hypothetical protein
MGERNADIVSLGLPRTLLHGLIRVRSVIDFEHWHPATIDPVNMDETEEMQRWGIKHRPPLNGGQAWKEWFRLEALAQQRGTRRPVDTNR